MIIFDNIYFLYFSFIQNKRLKYGPKHQASMLVAIYLGITTGIIILINNFLINILFYDSSTFHKNILIYKLINNLYVNKNLITPIVFIFVFIYSEIRYYYMGERIISRIEEHRNSIVSLKRKRLDTITLFTMVLLPVLLALLLNLKSSFIGVYP